MIRLEEFMNIFRLKEQGFSISAISRIMGHDRKTIRKYLNRGKGNPPRSKPRGKRVSKLDPFKEEILTLLHRHEHEFIPATVIYEKLIDQGYQGSLSLLQKWIKQYRNNYQRKVVLRYETLPGEQAQVDWGEKKIKDVKTGIIKKVYIFCMTLCWSRVRFVHFVPKQDMYHFLLCHKLAFQYFGGVTREILYDQNRCVLLKPGFRDIEFNRKFLDFAHHYGFIPRACKPYRAQTKGKVENLVKYVKRNFLCIQSTYHIPVLNQKKKGWLEHINGKVHSTTGEIPMKRLPHEALLAIEDIADYDLYYMETRKVFNDCTFSFKSRRYSVPPEYIGRFVTIKYRPERQRIDVYFNESLITQHRTDGDNSGQYVIKCCHRQQIWKQWRNEINLFYQQAKRHSSENHRLSVYEEVAQLDSSDYKAREMKG